MILNFVGLCHVRCKTDSSCQGASWKLKDATTNVYECEWTSTPYPTLTADSNYKTYCRNNCVDPPETPTPAATTTPETTTVAVTTPEATTLAATTTPEVTTVAVTTPEATTPEVTTVAATTVAASASQQQCIICIFSLESKKYL